MITEIKIPLRSPVFILCRSLRHDVAALCSHGDTKLIRDMLQQNSLALRACLHLTAQRVTEVWYGAAFLLSNTAGCQTGYRIKLCCIMIFTTSCTEAQWVVFSLIILIDFPKRHIWSVLMQSTFNFFLKLMYNRKHCVHTESPEQNKLHPESKRPFLFINRPAENTGGRREDRKTAKRLSPETASHLRVTMMAEGWAHAVMSVTMKRKMRNGMSVLQVRSHFPDTA